MSKLRALLMALAIMAGVVSLLPATVHAVGPATDMACGGSFLGFPKWYAHLPGSGSCQPTLTSLNQIWVIVLNIVDIMIRLAGIVAVGMILWAGFKYIRSEGEAAKTAEAKNTILSAVIGLVLVIAAVAIVEFAAGSIK